ncbi:MAG: hypothetical protein H0U64_05350 [Gemmatimonadaceae bacterium]|nr:hypothetical protein [Gemmatimonadaceae bacterium]
MSAPAYLTWRGDVANGINPYRPAVSDFGGVDKLNDAAYPPSPNEPSAEEWNQIVGQLAAFAQVLPAARIDVRFSAGVPSVFAVYSANSDLVVGDVTCTDTGTGIVTLSILASKLPDPRWGNAVPQATGNNTGLAFRNGAQSLRCEIRTAGTLADVNFLADWG